MNREYHEAVALMNWWAYEANARGLDQRLFMHIGNETGGAGARRGWFNKQMGTRAGAPDFFMAIPSQGYHGLFIELKAEKGRVSPAQKEMVALLESWGYVCKIAFGWDSARETILGYLGRNLGNKTTA